MAPPLATGDVSEEVRTDFSTAFRHGAKLVDADGMRQRIEVKRLGELGIRSGAVAVGDAFTGIAPLRPPSGAIAPGSYPVDLSLIHYEDDGACQKGDVRVATARIALSEAPVAQWVIAEFGAGVDSGTVAFSEGLPGEWAPDETDAERLLAELQTHPLGPSASALLGNAGGRELAIFSSGLGDGVYDAWWGLDAAGEPVALCVDFDLLVVPETIDVDVAWPRGRGAVHDETLAKHGVRLSVPWLAPGRLELRTEKKRHAYVRWRLLDGRFERVPVKRVGDVLRIEPEARTDGTLVVRIVIGDKAIEVVA